MDLFDEERSEQLMKLNENYILQEVADEYIVVPIGNAVNSLQGIIKLNSAGAFLWKKLQMGIDDESVLSEALMQEYDISEQDAKEDSYRFIQQIRDMGCLEY